MFKKRFLCLAAAIFLSLSLCACSSNETDSTSTSSSSDSALSIKQQVLYDENDIKIVAKSLETDGTFGPELALQITNNSDTDISVKSQRATINGVMVESKLSSTVSAGTSSDDTLYFIKSSLEKANITTLANLEFSLEITDSTTSTVIADTEQITLETSNSSYSQSYDSSGATIVDQNGIKINVQGTENDETLNSTKIKLYIENNSEDPVTIQARNTVINSIQIDPIFSCTIMPGKIAYSSLSFDNDKLAENSISAITDLQLNFSVLDCDTLQSIFETDTVSATIN